MKDGVNGGLTKWKNRFLKRYTKSDIKHFPFVYLIVALPVLHLAVFWVYVNFSTFLNAFVDERGDPSFESIIRVAKSFAGGIDNWGYYPLQMLLKSVAIWFNLHVLCCVIGIFTAFILTKHMILSKTFRIIYMIPGLVGAVVFSAIMKKIYAGASDGGPLVAVFQGLGVDMHPLLKKEGFLGYTNAVAFGTMYLQMFLFNITGGSMIIAGAYMKIPQEIFESAQIEGCGFFREGFQIAIPCAWPTISTTIVFSLCSFFTADYAFYLYSNETGKMGLQSIGFYLYQFQVKASYMVDNQYMVGYTSALGMFLTMITIPVVLLGKKLLTRIGGDIDF